jgi:uncharacterized protein
MRKTSISLKAVIPLILSVLPLTIAIPQKTSPSFKVVSFYTAKNESAHISFVHEANKWFAAAAAKYNFEYDSTNNWNNMNPEFLAGFRVVIFLDSRPDSLPQREAFQKYMESGGGFIGFHFSAFSLTPSAFPQNWDWYHNQFLGSGEYKSNTWRPTSANLRVEDIKHPVTKGLPLVFKSSPNEWYCWKNDLRKNPDIDILLSIDSTSFPLGTGPKLYEIWHSGYYPVVWTNRKYRMVYINLGHNDIDFESGSNRELSFTFRNNEIETLVANCLQWLGKQKKKDNKN